MIGLGLARAVVCEVWGRAGPLVAYRLRMAAQAIDPQPVMVFNPATGTHRIYFRMGDGAVPLADLSLGSGVVASGDVHDERPGMNTMVGPWDDVRG